MLDAVWSYCEGFFREFPHHRIPRSCSLWGFRFVGVAVPVLEIPESKDEDNSDEVSMGVTRKSFVSLLARKQTSTSDYSTDSSVGVQSMVSTQRLSEQNRPEVDAIFTGPMGLGLFPEIVKITHPQYERVAAKCGESGLWFTTGSSMVQSSDLGRMAVQENKWDKMVVKSKQSRAKPKRRICARG